MALAVGLVLGAAACGDDGDSASPTTTTSPAGPKGADAACELFRASDAATLFGSPARQRADTSATTQPEGVVSACVYETTNFDGQLVQFRVFDSPSYYSKSLVADGTALDGLGTRAYVNPNGPGDIVDLQFVSGDRVFTLAYSNSAGDAAARAATLEQVARAIDDRL